MDVVTTSLTDRFEILKIHVDLWNILYDLKNAPENEITVIYTVTLNMDLTLILMVSNYAQKL